MFPIRRLFALLALAALFSYPAASQQGIVYTATVIPAISQSAGTTTVRIQISFFTTDAELAQIKQAFGQGGTDVGMSVLRSMSKGYISVAGQGGRKIYAAIVQSSPEGKRLVLVTEHILSEYEKSQNARASDYPLTIARIQFDPTGNPLNGKVYSAVKVSVTPDGFLDVDSQTPNTGTIINIAQAN